jgi:cysteine synthase A
MPSSMSIERRKILSALGAKIVLSDASLGMTGAIEEAKRLSQTISNSYIPSQFDNDANPQIHRKTTAIEILNDCDSKVDIFISAVGTGGTLTGVADVLKKECDTKIIAVEPDISAVIKGDKPNPHGIQGIGAGFVPSILDVDLIDKTETISYEKSVEFSRKIAKEEGLIVGISSGANIAIASKIANENIGKNLTIVTILCDTAERYLSGDLYDI